MADDRMLQEAIEAIKSGQRSRARDLLTRLLRNDQNNVEYWLYMSTVVETQKERVLCLENVLKYDPDNETASRGLILMDALTPDENLTPVKPEREREWGISQIFDATGESIISKRQQPRTTLPLAQTIALGIMGLVVVSLILIPFIFGSERPTTYIRQGSTVEPFDTPGPTLTVPPTQTPTGGVPFVLTVPGPTPLSAFLEATYTPTPRYVNTPHPSEAFNSAMRSLDAGNYEAAIMFFDQFIQSEPTALDAKYYRGLAYLWSGEYEKARDEFLLIIDRDETFAPAYVGVAQAWLAINPEWVVGDELYKAVSLAPDFIEGHLTRAEYRLQRNVPQGVINDAEMALSINPDSGLAHYYMAAAYLLLEQPVEALESAQKARELDPTIVENYLVLGKALIENGRTAEALSPIQTDLTYVEGDGMTWKILGRAQQAAGYHESALRVFEKALSLNNRLLEIYYYQGVSYLALGDSENALERFRRAADQFPDWFEAQVGLTQMLYESGEIVKANNIITNIVSLAKTDEQLAALYYWRALTFEELGYLDLAERDWNQLVDLPAGAAPPEWVDTALNHLRDLGTASTPATELPTRVPTMTPSPEP